MEPIEFEKCPVCSSKQTVSRLACANEPSIAPGTFVSLDKLVTPIQDVNKIATPIVKAIVTHFDVCAACGTRYCTRAEIMSIPVEIQHRSGNVIRTPGARGYAK